LKLSTPVRVALADEFLRHMTSRREVGGVEAGLARGVEEIAVGEVLEHVTHGSRQSSKTWLPRMWRPTPAWCVQPAARRNPKHDPYR